MADASDGGTFDVHDPATGEVLAALASATSDDAVAALDAADPAQSFWARTAARDRAEILRRAFDLVTERAEDFALLMTLEMGKPLAEAQSCTGCRSRLHHGPQTRKLAPLTAQYSAQTMLDAGLPAGVLNVAASASASGISGPLLADPATTR